MSFRLDNGILFHVFNADQKLKRCLIIHHVVSRVYVLLFVFTAHDLSIEF